MRPAHRDIYPPLPTHPMTDDRLITLAIHTYDRAQNLKTILEKEGIPVTLQNVNLESPVVSSGVRVRIHEGDLPLALRIIENLDIFACDTSVASDKVSPVVLVPVDFSPHSLIACDYAFHIAASHNASIRILHTYLDPMMLSANMQLSDALTFDTTAQDEAIVDHEINAETKVLMDRFVKSLRDKIKRGDIPAVKFRTEIREGVPEDVIGEMARECHPMLIVMGTRGAGKKERELVGSVTAEVLDTCRYPVFTVPEVMTLYHLNDISEVILISSLDQEDILALDALYRLYPMCHFTVTLLSLPSKKRPVDSHSAEDSLLAYCRRHYEGYSFRTDSVSGDRIAEEYQRLHHSIHPDLVVVPNRKKNIFARLFNPGLAHKLLFQSDVPMIVIPV
ncbi:MAG: universal stress protein [Barnesiella sp.]|nr:universal stress protein [Barnesiella sp.]